jgi:hypothetical protein
LRHFTGKFAPRGNVGKFFNQEIEDWIEWNGEEGKLVEALISTGWIDVCDGYRLVVHDWRKHADDTTKKELGLTKEGFVSDMSSTRSRSNGTP